MIAYAFSGVIIVVTYFVWQKSKQQPTTLFYVDNKANKSIIEKCPSLKSYNPTPYLNGFLHTILASIRRPQENHTSNNEKVGDFGISVDWIDKGKGIDRHKPLLFIMPGLTGKVTDSYINTIVSEAHKQHFHNICIYNYRMLSPTANFFHKPKFYNYGLNLKPNEFQQDFTSPDFYGLDNDYYYFEEGIIDGSRNRVDLAADLHYTLTHLKEKYQFNKIVALGCSYGGAQLGLYLGRFGDIALVDAGVTVCTPHSMIISQKFLTTFMNLTLCKILQKTLNQNKHLFKNKEDYPHEWGINIKKALSCVWIEDFDTNFTSKVYGYRNIEAYYRHFSIMNRFPEITIPMLCISSADDGVCHIKALCKDELIANGKTIVCLAKAGGHIGFLEGWKANQTWFPKPALEFLRENVN